MNIEELKIVIVTRSMNINLYRKSISTVSLPFKKKRYLFTTADGYLYDVLKNDCDYVVNIDEDAFVLNVEALKDLIVYFIDNFYVNCGVPDGGVISVRCGHPLVTNPFFNIFNVKEIRKQFDINKIQTQSLLPEDNFKLKLPFHLIKLKYSYSNNEPYCKYFVWLASNFKILYLDAEDYKDGYSTVLKNHLGIPFLIHTWYSRLYGVDEFHTKRINDVFMDCVSKTEESAHSCKVEKTIETLGNRFYFPLKRKIKRLLVALRFIDYC